MELTRLFWAAFQYILHESVAIGLSGIADELDRTHIRSFSVRLF